MESPQINWIKSSEFPPVKNKYIYIYDGVAIDMGVVIDELFYYFCPNNKEVKSVSDFKEHCMSVEYVRLWAEVK